MDSQILLTETWIKIQRTTQLLNTIWKLKFSKFSKNISKRYYFFLLFLYQSWGINSSRGEAKGQDELHHFINDILNDTSSDWCPKCTSVGTRDSSFLTPKDPCMPWMLVEFVLFSWCHKWSQVKVLDLRNNMIQGRKSNKIVPNSYKVAEN